MNQCLVAPSLCIEYLRQQYVRSGMIRQVLLHLAEMLFGFSILDSLPSIIAGMNLEGNIHAYRVVVKERPLAGSSGR
jgi:hypothetical protein